MQVISRKLEEKIFIALSTGAAILTSIILILIIGSIAISAIPSLNPYFLTTPENETPGFNQGIANAIIGSIYLSLLSVIIATPLAVGTAIYLKKYTLENTFTKVIRFFIDVLSGTPSIVLGIFGLFFLVYYLKPVLGGFTLLTGSIALAILILPVIERSTEEALSTVPKELEDGSYALGAKEWDTIKNITIPYAISGIVTGMILGIGRAAEESAVVMLTAGYTQFMPEYGIEQSNKMLFGLKILPLNDLVASLPITVYHSYEFSTKVPISNAFASAFVLILIVMIINLVARLIIGRWKIG